MQGSGNETDLAGWDCGASNPSETESDFLSPSDQLIERIRIVNNFYEIELSKNAIALIDRLIAVLGRGHAWIGSSDRNPRNRIPADVFGRVNLTRWATNEVGQYLQDLKDRLEARGITLEHDFSRYGDELLGPMVDRSLLEVSRGLARIGHDFELQVISAEYDLIRRLLHILRTDVPHPRYKCCEGCFRAIVKGRFCGLHKSGQPRHYREVKKVVKQLTALDRNYLLKKKEIRELFGDGIVPFPNKRKIVDSISNSLVLSDYVQGLLGALESMHWSAASILIDKFIEDECPKVYEKVVGLAQEVSSFPEFVERCYSKDVLDNRYDQSRKPFWFLVTVLDAEDWFRAAEASEQVDDGRRKDNVSRDQLIVCLYRSGVSIRKIADIISSSCKSSIKKSTVENVIKNYKTEMQPN